MPEDSAFLGRLVERARGRRRRIAFPESADPRVRQAIAQVARLGIAEPVIVLGPAHAGRDAAFDLPGVEVVEPDRDPRRTRVLEDLLASRRDRGLDEREAAGLAGDPLFFAADLVRHGEVDGCVAGAVYTTAQVLRAALWLVGLAPGVRVASSAFYMVLPDFRGGECVLTYTDCAAVPWPTAAQLADIAIAAAQDRRRIVGDEPVVAFLSYSTLGSAGGESVERVREALRLTRERDPLLRVDGELQADAALIAAIGARKAPGSAAAGDANVLVFPNLDAGNIAYKLTERLAGARAIGPISQGLARPCSDLSRGASPDDITHVTAVTALQAGAG